MIDRGKVIKGLECCADLDDDCVGCPYDHGGEMGENACLRLKLIPDAISLLKEQEPVKPEFDSLDGIVGRWRCGNCHISIGAVHAPYCWHCGQAVKWDD